MGFDGCAGTHVASQPGSLSRARPSPLRRLRPGLSRYAALPLMGQVMSRPESELQVEGLRHGHGQFLGRPGRRRRVTGLVGAGGRGLSNAMAGGGYYRT